MWGRDEFCGWQASCNTHCFESRFYERTMLTEVDCHFARQMIESWCIVTGLVNSANHILTKSFCDSKTEYICFLAFMPAHVLNELHIHPSAWSLTQGAPLKSRRFCDISDCCLFFFFFEKITFLYNYLVIKATTIHTCKEI